MKPISKILFKILTFMGFTVTLTGCCKYGTPYSEFKALGTVTDENGEKIEGIKVQVRTVEGYTLEDDVSKEVISNIDSTTTNKYGKYKTDKTTVFIYNDIHSVVFSDIDGDANGGEFAPDTVPLSEMSIEKTGNGGGWNDGTYTAEINVQLNKK